MPVVGMNPMTIPTLTMRWKKKIPTTPIAAINGSRADAAIKRPRINTEARIPASTIGNFTPESAREFLINARSILGDGSYLLIGVDTKKSPDMLHRAYNDSQGVTARFNLNILERIGRHFICIGQFVNIYHIRGTLY